jgi:cation transport regulator
MPEKKNSSGRKKSEVDTALSTRTKKQIDSLPVHAQHIYQNPAKRRGGKSQSSEEVAHKTAWAAVKQKYKKRGDEWVKKE